MTYYSIWEIIIIKHDDRETLSSNIFTVYPNPFTSTLNVRFKLAEKGVIEMNVYNVLGDKLISIPEKEISEGEYTIPVFLPELPTGIYFLRIIIGNTMLSKKIIKQ